jgi:hypothetical protein
MPTTDIWQMEKHAIHTGSTRVFPRRSAAYWLAAGLVAASAAAAALTFFVPGVLSGPAAMNGSARGTALVVLALALPVLLWSMWTARAGGAHAVVVWVGACAYLLYNALLFTFATPFNELFLIYVAMLSLSLWTVIAMLASIDVHQLRRRFSQRTPVVPIAVYILTIVVLNTFVWLRGIVPALVDETPTAFLEDTGLTTNPVYVQDLAFWLPLAALAAIWLWQRRAWGYLIAGSVLVMWVIEAVSVAVDQWFGHAADPTSTVASAEIGWGFLALAIVGCVVLVPYMRNLRSR